jgi:hypothetical protein
MMTWHRAAHRAPAEDDPRPETSAGSGTAAGTAAGPAAPDPHAAELILAAVSAEGLPALLRVLLAARTGDRDAAGMRVGTLLRALPGTGWFTAHDLVSLAGITEATLVGELDPVQRSILTRNLGRTPSSPGSGAGRETGSGAGAEPGGWARSFPAGPGS